MKKGLASIYKKRTATTLIVVVIISLMHFFGWLRPAENFVVFLVRPITQGARNLGGTVGGTFRFFGSIGDLAEENNELQRKVEQLMAENSKFQEVEQENAALREQLNFSEKEDYVLEPTFVVGSDPTSFTEYLTIDKGSEKGMSVNDPVITQTGVLVGRIVETGWRSSKVLLMIDSTSTVNALIQESRASGVIHGEHGLGLRMELIPQEKVLKVGDRVVTSGLGGLFPKGLVIGEIEAVTQQENELFQTARVAPIVSFHDLEILFVIKEF